MATCVSGDCTGGLGRVRTPSADGVPRPRKTRLRRRHRGSVVEAEARACANRGDRHHQVAASLPDSRADRQLWHGRVAASVAAS